MSEYVDHFALLTEAETLTALRGQVTSVVDAAVIVALPLGARLDDAPSEAARQDKADAIWATLPSPRWVVIAAPGPLDDGLAHFEPLSTLGPALHLFTAEDGPVSAGPVRWRMHAIADGARWSVMVADTPWGDRWYGAPDAALFAAGTGGIGDGLAPLAKHMNVTPDAIKATLVPDGGAAFRRLAGIQDIELFDQFLFGYSLRRDGGVSFFHEPES